jgi:RNA polymerase sigma-54 factor
MYTSLSIGGGIRLEGAITPQAIIANSLLQLSSEDLEDAISKAVSENPALEMPAPAVCPYCRSPLTHGVCLNCAATGRNASIRRDDDGWWNDDSRWPTRSTSFEEDEEFDPMTILAAETTLSEHLRSQISALVSGQEQQVAEFIIDSLDEKGLLATPVAEIARSCECSQGMVEKVLRKVQSLDPPGVAARSVQECLLIQLAQMNGDVDEIDLAACIVREHWDALTKLSLDTIARQIHVGEQDVRQAIDFIGRNLNPFPSNSDWRGPGQRSNPSSVQPDIIVRRKRDPETGYEIEIPESRKYRLRVNTLYQQMVRDIRSGHCDASFREREHLREHLAQARLFINCVKQRWQTLERIALALVDVQEEFLERGYRLLKPLTRSQLADIVGVHESTVGRAVANKSLMLPSGRIVSLSDFFDGSLAIKCVIEEIILEEAQPLSDQRIAEVLQARGCDIARRTVAKYRDAIGVPPARVRAALKNRNWKPLWVPPEHAGSF